METYTPTVKVILDEEYVRRLAEIELKRALTGIGEGT